MSDPVKVSASALRLHRFSVDTYTSHAIAYLSRKGLEIPIIEEAIVRGKNFLVDGAWWVLMRTGQKRGIQYYAQGESSA